MNTPVLAALLTLLGVLVGASVTLAINREKIRAELLSTWERNRREKLAAFLARTHHLHYSLSRLHGDEAIFELRLVIFELDLLFDRSKEIHRQILNSMEGVADAVTGADTAEFRARHGRLQELCRIMVLEERRAAAPMLMNAGVDRE